MPIIKMELRKYFGKLREYANVYGGALAVTTMPLLVMEYISLSATGEHFFPKLSTWETYEVIGSIASIHAPIGYALGKISTEDLEERI